MVKFGGICMIELCENCEYSILIADVIGTLMTMDKDKQSFVVKVWYQNRELPLKFDSDSHFDFLQEGIRIDNGWKICYLWYDIIDSIEVVRR